MILQEPLRILLCSQDFFPNIGGIAPHIFHLAKCFQEMGHFPVVLTTQKNYSWSSYLSKKSTLHYIENVPVYEFSTLPSPNWRLTKPLLQVELLLRIMPAVYQLIKQFRFDLVHWHVHGWATEICKKINGIPKIYTNHTSRFLRLYESGSWEEAGYDLKLADRVIGVSRELAEKSVHIGIPAHKVHYIPNGVDTQRFYPGDIREARFCLGIDKSPVIVCARRIVPKNGVIFFARALHILAGQRCEATVVMVGNSEPIDASEYEREVQALFKALPREIRVIWLGKQPQERMPQIYQAGDISVLPSLAEATSIAGLESLACGTPLIGTKVGGIPEIIEDGRNGILVPPENPEALAQALQDLLNQKDTLAFMGLEARNIVQQKFSWPIIARQVLEVYYEVLAERRALTSHIT